MDPQRDATEKWTKTGKQLCLNLSRAGTTEHQGQPEDLATSSFLLQIPVPSSYLLSHREAVLLTPKLQPKGFGGAPLRVRFRRLSDALLVS